MKKELFYKPIDIKKELPKENGFYTVQLGNIFDKDVFAHGRFIGKKDDGLTHWIKECNGYFFTEEELFELLEKTFDTAHFMKLSEAEYFNKKQEYIKKQIL